MYRDLNEDGQSLYSLSPGGADASVLWFEQRGHENEGAGTDPETIRGPGHGQAGDHEREAEAGEVEADPHPSHGHRDGGQEDHVDVLAVQQGQEGHGEEVAQCDDSLENREIKTIEIYDGLTWNIIARNWGLIEDCLKMIAV